MTTYLIDCKCGNSVLVEVGQAGGRIPCPCGAVLDVPPLRKLRHLPVAAVEQKRSATRWGTRHGVIAASLIVVAALVAVNIWSWITQPVVPKFDPAVYLHNVVEQRLSTPVEGWMWWIEYYRPLCERGFSVLELSDRAEIERQIAHREAVRRTLWVVAGIFAATAAAAALWPTEKTR
jgi:hypothetical protein